MKPIEIYHKLEEDFGRQNWWPADSEFEMIVGAILTQNTSWRNVEKAMCNLREEGLLDSRGMLQEDKNRIRELIRPSGYYNLKTNRLKSFLFFLQEKYDGSLSSLLSLPKEKLRSELLSIKGIGPETADSIVLYGAHKPSFVVDAYTRRIFSRLGLVEENISYDRLQEFFEKSLDADTELYKEYHALIVELGKNYCGKSNPKCRECPLVSACDFAKDL